MDFVKKKIRVNFITPDPDSGCFIWDKFGSGLSMFGSPPMILKI